MPGLVAIVDWDKKVGLGSLLDRMCRSLKHEEWYQVNQFVHREKGIALGRVHLGIFNPEPQPVFNEDRSLAILMDGEIFDYEEKKTYLLEKGHKFLVDNDPEFILHLYEEVGENFVHMLNGSFSLLIWDGRKGQLIVASDRYGLRPLYFAEVGGKLLFASEVKAILEDPAYHRRVNDVAVAQLFAFGHLLGDETMFQGISAFPPASIWIHERGRLKRRQYWSPSGSGKSQRGSETEYLEEINRRFCQALKRQVAGGYKIGVPLSGGLDSRCIMAGIDHTQTPVFSYTFGIPGATDILLAPKISEVTNRKHRLYLFQPDFLAKYAPRVVGLTDGMLNISHTHGLVWMREVREHAQVLLSGMAGELCRGLLTDNHVLAARSEPELNAIIAKKYRLYNPTFRAARDLENVFSSAYVPRIKGLADHSLLSEATSLGNSMPTYTKADYFFLVERTRRFNTMGLVFIASQLEHRTPFLDNDYVDIILESPLSLRVGTKIPAWLIGRNNPALTQIPRDKTGIPLDASPLAVKANDALRFAHKAVNKIAKTKLERCHFYTDLDGWMRNELRGFVESILLDRRTFERGYYNEAQVRQLVDRHMQKKADLQDELCVLITFELFQRQFLD